MWIYKTGDINFTKQHSNLKYLNYLSNSKSLTTGARLSTKQKQGNNAGRRGIGASSPAAASLLKLTLPWCSSLSPAPIRVGGWG